MSGLFDIEGTAVMAERWSMTKDELRAWTGLILTLIVASAYVAVVLGRAQDDPLSEISYAAPMLWSIGIGIVAAILVEILLVILIPSARAEGDERDREINRFGEYTGQSLVIVGGLVALVLALLEADYFWIANALYLAFVLSAVLSSVAKIVAYRKGVPTW
jgi:hypothetical protein